MHSFAYGHLSRESPGVRCPVKKVFDERRPDSEPRIRTVFGALAAMSTIVPVIVDRPGHGRNRWTWGPVRLICRAAHAPYSG
ncbi:hypothetical protein GA0115254_104215 [Streptomyces sp. Ncost-T10-10d]|nr:hypothetical protein GA0115254_104215 [Streptomyces sp. Ncost-T10-10d]